MRKRLFAGALLTVPVLAAAALSPLSLQPGSRVWVDGTSTVRAWHCESARAVGTAAAATTELAQLASVAGAQVTVPVGSLDCHNNTMNGHMRNALKAAANAERPVTLSGTVARENGQLRVRGTKRITMTEWGVRPPSLMLGTMKVNPVATIGFDVVLKP
jgi:hypothetical protein